MKKKLLSFLLTVLILFSFSPIAFATEGQEKSVRSTGLERPVDFTQMLINDVKIMSLETGGSFRIADIKQVEDFAGNSYILIEFIGTGYMLFHGETGEIAEYSQSDPSPYLGYDEDLYYGGPTFYYIRHHDEYVSTLYEDETISEYSDIIDQLSDKGDEISNIILAETNIRVFGTDEGLANKDQLIDVPLPEINMINVNPISGGVYIGNNNKIKDMDTPKKMGYMGFSCGYNAAAIMLFCIDECLGVEKYVDDFIHINNEKTGFLYRSLSKELYNCGNQNTGTIPADIQTALSAYETNHSLTGTVNAVSFDNTMSFDPIYQLVSQDKPVCIFGNYQSIYPDSDMYHVITAYGRVPGNTIDQRKLITHFGIENASQRTISRAQMNALNGGSSSGYVYFSSTGYSTISFSDISSSHWAYKGAEYAVRYNYLSKKANNSFKPNDEITRGEYLNMLYVAVGKPNVGSTDRNNVINHFYDVNSNTPFLDAAAWAYRENMLNGVYDSTYNRYYAELGDSLERQQAVVFVRRLHLGVTNVNVSDADFGIGKFSCSDYGDEINTSDYPDWNSIASWAKKSIKWALRAGIIKGSKEGDLLYILPEDNITRGQAAKIIMNITSKCYKRTAYFNGSATDNW